MHLIFWDQRESATFLSFSKGTAILATITTQTAWEDREMWKMNEHEDVHGVMIFRIAWELHCLLGSVSSTSMVHWSIFIRIYLPGVADSKGSRNRPWCPLWWYSDIQIPILVLSYYIQHSSSKVYEALHHPTPTMQLSNAPAHSQPMSQHLQCCLVLGEGFCLATGQESMARCIEVPFHPPAHTIPRKSAYSCYNGCFVFLFSVNFKSFKSSHTNICFYMSSLRKGSKHHNRSQ